MSGDYTKNKQGLRCYAVTKVGVVSLFINNILEYKQYEQYNTIQTCIGHTRNKLYTK